MTNCNTEVEEFLLPIWVIAGMSLSDYLLAQIKEIAERPTLAELRERLHKRKPVSAPIDTAHLVREECEAR